MPISHLFNLAKTLLGEKKVVPEKQMSYSKAFRHPHTEFVLKRALSSQDKPWSKLTDLLGNDGALSAPWTDAEQCCQGACLTPSECQGRDAPASMLCTITHMWCTQDAVWGKGCQVGQGKWCRAMQATCPGFKTFNKVLQWKTACDSWHTAILWR